MSNKSENTHIKRIAAVHDLCGYGKCSLGIAMPVLSAAGIEVCPVPTGIFSAHTAMDKWENLDTTTFLPKYVGSWAESNIKMDAIYSGFLSSADQIDIIFKLYMENPDALRVVDPVMGDDGDLYKTYTDELCEKFKSLADAADIITPNITEASILLDTEYNPNIDIDEAKQLVKALKGSSNKSVVLKGIQSNNEIFNIIIDSNDEFSITKNNYLPYHLHGTGDLFCSCLTACLLNDIDVHKATKFAGDFVEKAVELSITQPGFKERGVSFEPLMYNIIREINQNN